MNKTISFLMVAAGALALAACGDSADSGPVPSGPIEQVPAPEGGDWTTMVTKTPAGGFLMGNPNAPVKLVEYASMTCPHCREFEETAMEPLLDTYVKSGQVSLEFRNYVLNGLDLAASVVARCAGEAGFYGLTRQLYADQMQWIEQAQSVPPETRNRIEAMPPAQKLGAMADIAGLKEWASLRGLPKSRAEQCLSDQGAIDELVQMQSDGSAAGVTGTPTFAINGDLLELDATRGTWEQVERAIRRELG